MIRLINVGKFSEKKMKITKNLLEKMVREELNNLDEGGMGTSPSGRTIDPTKFSPDMIANLMDLVANIKNLVRQGASIDDVAAAIEQSESHLHGDRGGVDGGAARGEV